MKARLCGRDDLRQAGIAPFSNHEALKWKDLEQEELINTQEAKFNPPNRLRGVFPAVDNPPFYGIKQGIRDAESCINNLFPSLVKNLHD